MSRAKTSSIISRERIIAFLRARYDALADFTPDRLRQVEADWDSGQLRGFALAMEKIKETDDVLKGVTGKREKGPSVRGWEVLTLDNSAEALRHKEALEYFYNNLTVTNAIDENERGGAALMIRQMQLAVAFRYSAHEIVWQPDSDGVTATLRHVPLWFFENTTGRLRFLETEGAWFGTDLEEGGWMVTVGDFLMRACARAWLYKHLPLRDWLIYCGRHGMPGVAGKTTSQPGSPQWKQMEDAVEAFAAEFAAVFSAGDAIEKIDLTAAGELPYPKLVDRMDRAMAALWRGNDLSTISQGAGQGTGASIQGDETEILVASDALMISEAAQYYLDRNVIYFTTGSRRRPLAYFAIKGVTRKNIDQDLKVDRALFDMGVALSRKGLCDRYGRPIPSDESDSLVKTPGAPPLSQEITAANSADLAAVGEVLAEARTSIAGAAAADLEPIARRIAELIPQGEGQMTDAEVGALRKFAAEELPDLARKALGGDAAAAEFEKLFAAAFLSGATEAAT